MKVPRIFVDSLDEPLTIKPRQEHHLTRVLRLAVGDQVEVCDGRGQQVQARVVRLRPLGLEVEQSGDRNREPRIDLSLGLSLCKGERFDRAVEKAAELGVGKLIPVVSERSVLRCVGRQRVSRWRRLAEEAAALSGRARLPEVYEPMGFAELLGCLEAAHRLVLTEGAAGMQGPLAGSVALLVGPEGGWTEPELESARQAGWHAAGLGPRNLRVETAATLAVGLALYLAGELDGATTT